MKRIYLITFLIAAFFLTFSVNAEKLVLQWAVPLKDNILTQLNKREQGGVTVFGKDLLVTTSKGNMHLFSANGSIKKTIQFDGEFIHSPKVLDDGNLLVSVSNSLFLLSPKLEKIWVTSGKAPIASIPLVKDNNIYAQFMDNSVYLLDRTNGEIKTAYTYYADEDISMLRLSAPFLSNEKIVVGFANGMIIYFMHRKTSTDELVPYYKFKTARSMKLLEKKEFFDVLSIIPYKDTIIFSNGEHGGKIVEGKVKKIKEMRNLNLIREKDNSITGFGETGILKFTEDGKFVDQPFKSTGFVTNCLDLEETKFVTTTGAGSIINYQEGHIHLLSKDYKKILFSIMIPNGVSASATSIDNSVFIISDMGVVYRFNVIK